MEARNITLTFKKAKEFYYSDSNALKEVALQAFTEDELTTYTSIETFEDACRVLKLNVKEIASNPLFFSNIAGLNRQFAAIYQLIIIHKALNGKNFKMIGGEPLWLPRVEVHDTPSFGSTIVGKFVVNDSIIHEVYGNLASPASRGVCVLVQGIGQTNMESGMLACKSKEIAEYMSAQFGKLIFDACYAQYAYKWID